jgi:hypothetical protein
MEYSLEIASFRELIDGKKSNGLASDVLQKNATTGEQIKVTCSFWRVQIQVLINNVFSKSGCSSLWCLSSSLCLCCSIAKVYWAPLATFIGE